MANKINPHPVPDSGNVTRAQWNVRTRPSIKAQLAAIATERGEPLCSVAEEAFRRYLETASEAEAVTA